MPKRTEHEELVRRYFELIRELRTGVDDIGRLSLAAWAVV